MRIDFKDRDTHGITRLAALQVTWRSEIAPSHRTAARISRRSQSCRRRIQSSAWPRRVQRLIRSDRKAGVHLCPSTMVNAPALARPRVSDNAGTSRRMFVRVVQTDFEDSCGLTSADKPDYFVAGKPAAFQALKVSPMERTFL